MKYLALLSAASLLTACADTPMSDLPSSNPASSSAAESPSATPEKGLMPSPASLATEQLLTQPYNTVHQGP